MSRMNPGRVQVVLYSICTGEILSSVCAGAEVKARLVNCRPQSVTRSAGMPNQQTHLDIKALVTVVESMEESGMASNHLVKQSQHVRRYLNP